MKKNYVCINGSFVPEDRAFISVFDRGLNYGDGVFETIRADRGTVHLLDEHLKRLEKGTKAIGIAQAPLKGFFDAVKNGAIETLLKKNGLSKSAASVRITVTRGVDKSALAPSRGLTPTVIIITRPLDAALISKLQKKGVKAVLLKDYSPAIPGIKSLNFLPNVIGKMEALRKGSAEGIFIGADSTVREGTSANIFLASMGAVKTPAPGVAVSEGVLPGVMRAAVIRLAKKTGLDVKEAALHEDEILVAEEAFLTNSIIGVVPLIMVDSKPVGGGRPGKITRILQAGLAGCGF